MSQFKSKEEYEKWKAEKAKTNLEKLQKQKEKEDRLRRLKEEEERLSSIWICPECLSSNDVAQIKCNCGYTADETLLQGFKGNLTSADLYKLIKDDFDMLNNTKAIFLSHYLIKRFPDSEEARKIKGRMDSDSIEVVCGKCGTNNIYNLKYYKKEKCDRCGEWLYQYIKSNSEKTELQVGPRATPVMVNQQQKIVSKLAKNPDTIVCRRCKKDMVPISIGLKNERYCPLCGANVNSPVWVWMIFIFVFLVLALKWCS